MRWSIIEPPGKPTSKGRLQVDVLPVSICHTWLRMTPNAHVTWFNGSTTHYFDSSNAHVLIQSLFLSLKSNCRLVYPQFKSSMAKETPPVKNPVYRWCFHSKLHFCWGFPIAMACHGYYGKVIPHGITSLGWPNRYGTWLVVACEVRLKTGAAWSPRGFRSLGVPGGPRISVESLRRVGEINGKTMGNHHQIFVKVICLMVSRFQDGFKLVQTVWRCWKNHGMIGWDDCGIFFGDLNPQKAIGKHVSILLGMGKTCLIN